MPGPTAYFLFCQEHRAEEKERLLSDGRGKVNVAEVAKARGEKWKALSDEQKAEWKTKAEEARAAMPPPEEGAEEEQGEDGEAKAGTSRPDHLPLSTVRKVRESHERQRCRCSDRGCNLHSVLRARDAAQRSRVDQRGQRLV